MKEDISDILKWYFIIILLIGIFIILIVKGSSISPVFTDARWALGIAILLVLPLFVIPLIQYLGPRLSGIKISVLGILELNLTNISPSSSDDEELNDTLKKLSPYSDYLATSQAIDIHTEIERLKTAMQELKEKNKDWFVVNLGKGNRWIVPNLYYLIYLLEREVLIKQIVFIETQNVDNVYIGMCSPSEVLKSLTQRYPGLADAVGEIRWQGTDVNHSVSAQSFFQYLNYKGNQEMFDIWLNSSVLCQSIGLNLIWKSISWKEKYKEKDYTRIILSAYPYTAVVKDGRFFALISRDDIALQIAKNIV
jgi:hypothetical protein